jgi:hypothetical protein
MSINFKLKPLILSFLLSLFIVNATSCWVNSNDLSKYISFLEDYDYKEVQRIIIVPKVGCSGCIADAVKFILQNRNRLDSTLIVFTNIDDYKGLKIILGNAIKDPKIHLDTLNLLYNPMDSLSIYPTIVELNGNKDFKRSIFNSALYLREY